MGSGYISSLRWSDLCLEDCFTCVPLESIIEGNARWKSAHADENESVYCFLARFDESFGNTTGFVSIKASHGPWFESLYQPLAPVSFCEITRST